MKGRSFVLVIGCLVVAYSSSYAQKFVAYGDTRDNPSTHVSVLSKIAEENPDFVLHVGDMSGNTSTWNTQFKVPVSGNSTVNKLWEENKLLVTWGGDSHDGSVSWFTGISPPVCRNNSTKYTYTSSDGKVFVAVCGYKLEGSDDLEWLISSLQSAAAKSAKWRLLMVHAIICYNSGKSGRAVNNPSAVKAICDSLHVELTFSGHEHYYQRSKLMQNETILQSGSEFDGTAGTVFNVVGDGGAPRYDPGSAASFVQIQNNSIYGYSLVEYTDNSVTVTHKTTSGSVVDQYTWTKGATAVAQPVLQMENAELYQAAGENKFLFSAPPGARYAVFSIAGKLLTRGSLSTSTDLIDLGRAEAGIYFITLNFSGTTMMQKVIIR